MASKEAESKKNEDSTSRHVLDYYKKFSQNRDLPKYFSGTSLSYLPEFQESLDEYSPDIIVKTDVDLDIVITTIEDNDQRQPQEEHDTSRASSALSNRKLEWDNLADIGYSNSQKVHTKNLTLKRSSSLPLVFQDSKRVENDLEQLIDKTEFSRVSKEQKHKNNDNRKVFVYNYSDSSSDNRSSTNDKKFSSSSSSFVEEKKPVYTSTSSSNPPRQSVASSETSSKQSITNFAYSLSYLKKKVGLPEAQSTPNTAEDIVENKNVSDTPRLKKVVKPVKNISSAELSSKVSKKSSSKKRSDLNLPVCEKPIKKVNMKVVNLCVTKPVSLECVDKLQKSKTEITEPKKKNVTVGIQTESISEKELIKIITKTQGSLNQSVVFFEHSESDKNTCSTQTSSDKGSRCDSFEYMKQVEVNEVTKKMETKISYDFDNATAPDVQTEPKKILNLEKSHKQDDLELQESEDSSLSNEVILANAVSSADFNKNNNGLENKIYLLQRLLKSKKYDDSTKKRYIKKIIQKITESTYWDESSNSSELFFPKKSKEAGQKLVHLPTSISSSSSCSHKGILKHTNLTPFEEKAKASPRNKKLEIKTFVQDILPENVPKDDLTTSASEILPVDSFELNRKSKTKTASESKKSSVNTGSEKQYNLKNSRSASYENWKEDKTVSEKVFEERYSSGDGDYFTHIASKEKEHQLNWINNEIDHLGKIKSLLESHTKKSKDLSIPKNSQKVTSVYLVSKDKEKAPRKKYVIQTEVTAHLGGQRRFQIEGERYTIGDADQQPTCKIFSDIEVTATDTTTNINVKTFCEVCKRSPCVCVTEFLDCVKNPFVCERDFSAKENSEESLCKTCKNLSNDCTCIESRSNKTICLVCHTVPCLCSKSKSKTGTIPKICSKCVSHPCRCSAYRHACEVSDYVGQFIPVQSTSNKNSDFSSKSSKTRSSSKPPVCCEICRKYHLSEEIQGMSSKGSSQKDDTSQKTDDSSLKRMFQDCRCNVHSKCNCGFVNKLYKRFNKNWCPKTDNIYANKDIQVEKCDCQHIAIQTSVETDSKNMQTSTDKENKLLQTEAKQQTGKHIGIQTQSAMTNESIQTSEVFLQSKDLPDKHARQMSSQTISSNLNVVSETTETDKLEVGDKQIQIPQPKSADAQTGISYRNPEMVSQEMQSQRPKSADAQTVAYRNAEMLNKEIQSLRPKSAEAQTSQRFVYFQETELETHSQRSNTRLPISKRSNITVGDAETVKQKIVPVGRRFTDTTETQSKGPISENIQTDKPQGTVTFSQTQKASTTQQLQTDIVNFVSESTQVDTVHYHSEAVQTSGSDEDKNTRKIKCAAAGADKKDACCQCSPIRNSKVDKMSGRKDSKSELSSAEYVDHKPEKDNSAQTKDRESSVSSDKNKSDNEFSTSGVTSSTAPTTPSNLSSYITCVCCKRHTPSGDIGILRQNDLEYPFCSRCIQKRPMLTTICYSGSNHICTCLESETTEMATVPTSQVEEYCSCIKPYSKRHTQYCSHCQNRLRKTLKSKNGIAYCLTLHCESPSKYRSRRKKKQLEEIKVKVPGSRSRKMYKDKENFTRKNGTNKTKQNAEDEEKDKRQRSESGTSGVDLGEKKSSGLVSDQKYYTLQEYLEKNRPDFIDSAEYRRRAVLSSKLGRTITKDEEKLRFLDENLRNEQLRKEARLFTEKEMREITKRNYRKLPEVQQKLLRYREQRLKHADRFITSTLTKKIQGAVLKGKSRFPLDSKVVDMK